MNTYLSALGVSIFFSVVSFASTESIDRNELRKAYQRNVETVQLPFFLKDEEATKTAVLSIDEIDPVDYDLPDFFDYHLLACKWVKELGADKLTALAEALREKTKVGDVISGQEREQRLKGKIFGNSAKKLLGKGFVKAITKVAVASDQVYGWSTAVQLYETAITKYKEQPVWPIFVCLKLHSKGSTIKFSEYIMRLSARYINLCKTFVDSKMVLFDSLPKDPVQNNNNL